MKAGLIVLVGDMGSVRERARRRGGTRVESAALDQSKTISAARVLQGRQ